MNSFTEGTMLSGSALRSAAVIVATVALLSASVVGPAHAATSDTDDSFPGCPVLIEGNSTGQCVTQLKSELNAVSPAYTLDIDNDQFDAATRIAVLDFQGKNHLDADGNVGPQTAGELQRQYQQMPGVDDPAINSDPPANSVLGCPDPSAVEEANLLPVYPDAVVPGINQDNVRMSYGDLHLLFAAKPNWGDATCTLESNRGALPIVLHFYKTVAGISINLGNQTVAQSVTTATLRFIPAAQVQVKKCDFSVMHSVTKEMLLDTEEVPDNAMKCLLNDASADDSGYVAEWSIPGFEEWAPTEKDGLLAYTTGPLTYYVDMKTLQGGATMNSIDSGVVNDVENYIHKPATAPRDHRPLLGCGSGFSWTRSGFSRWSSVVR